MQGKRRGAYPNPAHVRRTLDCARSWGRVGCHGYEAAVWVYKVRAFFLGGGVFMTSCIGGVSQLVSYLYTAARAFIHSSAYFPSLPRL
jgi:hypothetical protein